MAVGRSGKPLSILMFFLFIGMIFIDFLLKSRFLNSGLFTASILSFFLGWVLLVVAKWPQVVEEKSSLGIDEKYSERYPIYIISYILFFVGCVLSAVSLFY